MMPTEPGRVALLDTHTRRRKWGESHRTIHDSIHADFGVATELVMDIDCRKLLERVSIDLASHFESSLLAGRSPEDGAELPEVGEVTRAIEPSRRGGWAVRSGWMATHWWLGTITGGMFQARRLIKPNGTDGRDKQINRWLAPAEGRPVVDMQSIAGESSRVIERSLQDYVAGAYGQTVTTPTKATTRTGTLPDLR